MTSVTVVGHVTGGGQGRGNAVWREDARPVPRTGYARPVLRTVCAHLVEQT